ncbi:MAG: helix-turn-helix domain-containing protein, partial [Acidimicrobiia bacterium]
MKVAETATRRPYAMTKRARAAEETGERILDAALARLATALFDEVTLDAIAADAGVTVQTVLRRFGSKEDLFSRLVEREGERISAQRTPRPEEGSDMPATIRVLVSHYESDGRMVLNLLRQEDRFPLIAETLESARREHEEWVSEHLGPVLDGSTGRARRRRLDAALAATDIYVWKLLRIDRGKSVGEVEETMLML